MAIAEKYQPLVKQKGIKKKFSTGQKNIKKQISNVLSIATLEMYGKKTYFCKSKSLIDAIEGQDWLNATRSTLI
ncbi:MAG: hypothetical protein RLZZ628_1290 [Bacteroidota bacterium]|jgi:hypothetical protein